MGLYHEHLLKKVALEGLVEEEAKCNEGYDRHRVGGCHIPRDPFFYQTYQVLNQLNQSRY